MMTNPATPLDNLDRINRIDAQLDRATEAILAVAARGEEFDRRLEDTRSLVAENAKGNAELKQSIATTNAGINTLRKVVDDMAAESAQNDVAIANHSANIENLLADARADRAEYARRFDAQNEVIQTLLVELTRTNQRINNLEQAG